MEKFSAVLRLPFPAREAYRWHIRPGAFERLIPPWEDISVGPRPDGIAEGSRLSFSMKKGPFRLTWEALHRDFVEDRQFVDVMVRGPFGSWVHRHRFEAVGEGQSELRDEIELALPSGIPNVLGRPWVKKDLERLFAFRHARTLDDMTRHQRHARSAPGLFAMTGATGFIGRRLWSYLCGAGHTVLPILRSGATKAGDILWDPESSAIEVEKLEGLRGVIHLAGENIAGRRWRGEVKERILKSRVQGTRVLCEAIARLKKPPAVLVSASAIGWYGDGGAEELDEHSPGGKGFLAEVCDAWEKATEPARSAGIRVVNLRIGVVLSAKGGALAQMLTPFKLGLGGPIGGGRQFVSWITLDDLLGVIEETLLNERLSGPVNATAPDPVPQGEFAKALGRVLSRPAFAPLPGIAARAALGEMAGPLLIEGARVLPAKLMDAGFPFLHLHLEGALRAELGLVKYGAPLQH